jgi:hypothetical protein
MLEARILAQATIDRCEALRRARNGDELALARTHHDASRSLPHLFGRLRAWLSTADPAALVAKLRGSAGVSNVLTPPPARDGSTPTPVMITGRGDDSLLEPPTPVRLGMGLCLHSSLKARAI